MKVLRFLRRFHECAAKEAGEIKKSAESIPKFTLKKQLHQLYKQHVYLPLAILLCLFAVKNLSGPFVLEFYSPIIMEEAGGNNPHTAATCSVGASELVGTILSAALVDRVGRKPLLVLGGIGRCSVRNFSSTSSPYYK